MNSLENWKRLYAFIAVVLLGVAVASFVVTDSLLIPVLAGLIGIGAVAVRIRPSAYPLLMLGNGILLLSFTGILVLRDASITLVALVLLVGILSVMRGIQHR